MITEQQKNWMREAIALSMENIDNGGFAGCKNRVVCQPDQHKLIQRPGIKRRQADAFDDNRADQMRHAHGQRYLKQGKALDQEMRAYPRQCPDRDASDCYDRIDRISDQNTPDEIRHASNHSADNRTKYDSGHQDRQVFKAEAQHIDVEQWNVFTEHNAQGNEYGSASHDPDTAENGYAVLPFFAFLIHKKFLLFHPYGRTGGPFRQTSGRNRLPQSAV